MPAQPRAARALAFLDAGGLEAPKKRRLRTRSAGYQAILEKARRHGCALCGASVRREPLCGNHRQRLRRFHLDQQTVEPWRDFVEAKTSTAMVVVDELQSSRSADLFELLTRAIALSPFSLFARRLTVQLKALIEVGWLREALDGDVLPRWAAPGARPPWLSRAARTPRRDPLEELLRVELQSLWAA